MTEETDRRAVLGGVIGVAFGYAFGSGKHWAWMVAIVIGFLGIYTLERWDERPCDDD